MSSQQRAAASGAGTCVLLGCSLCSCSCMGQCIQVLQRHRIHHHGSSPVRWGSTLAISWAGEDPQALGDQMTWFVPESPEELRPHHGHPVMDLSSSHTPLEWMGRVCVRTPLSERFKEVSGVELISPCVAATLLLSACQGNNWSILK